jgi:hypothetical protein
MRLRTIQLEPITMNAMRCPALCLIAGLFFTAVPALHAQSLADFAKKEQERRQSVKDGKSYSNKDLKEGPPPNIVSSSSDGANASDAKGADAKPADGAAAAADARTAAKPAEAKAADGKPALDPKNEQAWRDQNTALREKLERDKVLAEALQSRVNALTTDFVNRDDPAQRAVIESDRTRAMAELDRTRAAIEDDVKAMQAFEEEARRLGVPAGWLR